MKVAGQFLPCVFLHGNQAFLLFHQILIELGVLQGHHRLIADGFEQVLEVLSVESGLRAGHHDGAIALEAGAQGHDQGLSALMHGYDASELWIGPGLLDKDPTGLLQHLGERSLLRGKTSAPITGG